MLHLVVDCLLETDLQVTSGADNRNLLSLNEESQTLNKDSIKTLKQEGLSGQVYIDLIHIPYLTST